MEVYVAPVIYCLSTVGGERSVSCLGHFTHMRLAPVTKCAVGWAGPRATLDALG
jgi:cbb3-type cytochrome oxidase subunit 1